MEIDVWGTSFMNTIALLKAITHKAGCEKVILTVQGNELIMQLTKGDNSYTVPLNLTEVSEANIVDVLANVAIFARIEHAASIHSNRSIH